MQVSPEVPIPCKYCTHTYILERACLLSFCVVVSTVSLAFLSFLYSNELEVHVKPSGRNEQPEDSDSSSAMDEESTMAHHLDDDTMTVSLAAEHGAEEVNESGSSPQAAIASPSAEVPDAGNENEEASGSPSSCASPALDKAAVEEYHHGPIDGGKRGGKSMRLPGRSIEFSPCVEDDMLLVAANDEPSIPTDSPSQPEDSSSDQAAVESISSGTQEPQQQINEKEADKSQPSSPSSQPAYRVEIATAGLLVAAPQAPPMIQPELKKSVGEKLQCCIEVLQTSFDTDTVTWGASNSKVVKRLDRVTRYLHSVILSHAREDGQGDKPGALHVCGVPGAGKSIGVKWCCARASEWAKEELQEWEGQPTFCYINAAHLQNLPGSQAMDMVERHLSQSLGRKSFHASSLKRSNSGTARPTVIVVMDEIDLLVESLQTEEVIRTLLVWSSDENMAFGLIGISNSIENAKGRRLNTLGSVRLLLSVVFCYCLFLASDLVCLFLTISSRIASFSRLTKRKILQALSNRESVDRLLIHLLLCFLRQRWLHRVVMRERCWKG
jgi:hypothetical protein